LACGFQQKSTASTRPHQIVDFPQEIARNQNVRSLCVCHMCISSVPRPWGWGQVSEFPGSGQLEKCTSPEGLKPGLILRYLRRAEAVPFQNGFKLTHHPASPIQLGHILRL
jgi:hypothetical protein